MVYLVFPDSFWLIPIIKIIKETYIIFDVSMLIIKNDSDYW